MKERATRLLALFLSVTMAASPAVSLRAETLEATKQDVWESESGQDVKETVAESVEDSSTTGGQNAVNEIRPVSENIPAATGTAASGQESAAGGTDGTTVGKESATDGTDGMTVGKESAADGTDGTTVGKESTTDSTQGTMSENDDMTGKAEGSITEQKDLNISSENANTEAGTEGKKEALAKERSAETSASAVQVLKTDGTAFKMFVISNSSVAVKEDKIQITMETSSVSYNKIYLGNPTDEVKNPVIEGVDTGSGFIFTFEVPLSDAGQQIPISLCKKKDGTWYTGQALVLTIPAVAAETPTPTATPTLTPATSPTPTPTPEGSEEDTGFQVIKTEDDSVFKMFVIDSYTSKVKGDVMQITITTSNSGYNKIYLGPVTDEVKEPVIEGVPVGDGYSFTFELPVSAAGTQQPISLWGVKKSEWYTSKELALVIPASAARDEETGTPTPTPVPEPSISVPADGDYSTTVESSAAMFKVVNCVLTLKDGEMTAMITLGGTGYDYLYMGSAENAKKADSSDWIKYVENAAKQYTFTIPVSALDTPIAIAAHSVKKNEWYDRTLTFKSEDLKRILENGKYSIEVESSASMFKVVDCVLTSFNGELMAKITLGGTGYDTLYMGTAENAAKADSKDIITYTLNDAGEYTFLIPVSALDTPIAIAAHSVRKDVWYDRTLTFKSDTLVKIGDSASDNSGNQGGSSDQNTNNNGNNNNSGSSSKPDTTPDTESKYESDTSGSTSAVNSATTLADGVYTPDRFAWSGGSGRVSLSCTKVTVTNGQAYATIVFNSDAYSYVKANGRTYYGSNGGGTSVFVIPVELNKNNTILGMTTKMSASHEVAYNIFVYIAAASNAGTLSENTNKVLDDDAPEIMGLEYESETELEYAEYFKIFHYQDGITLLEIDMTKDTARDPEKLEETDSDASKDAETADSEETSDTAADEVITDDTAVVEDGEDAIQTDAEVAAELYKGNVVKYLIVPEDVEIPVGLDKEMIVVQLPADKAYVASEEVLGMMDELKLLGKIAAVGFEKDDCELNDIVTAMDDEEILFAGTYEEPDYKALLKAKTNLVILPDEILPIEENAAGSSDKKDAKADEAQAEDAEKDSKKQEDDTEKLSVEEQTERLEEITDRLATLGIPIIVDRSEDEKEELAKREWIKVYGILFGCEETAEKLFAAAVKDAK